MAWSPPSRGGCVAYVDALRTGGEAFVLGVPRALENVHHTFAFYSSGLKGSSSLETGFDNFPKAPICAGKTGNHGTDAFLDAGPRPTRPSKLHCTSCKAAGKRHHSLLGPDPPSLPTNCTPMRMECMSFLCTTPMFSRARIPPNAHAPYPRSCSVSPARVPPFTPPTCCSLSDL
jgi:hypothetical protein